MHALRGVRWERVGERVRTLFTVGVGVHVEVGVTWRRGVRITVEFNVKVNAQVFE